MRIITLALFLDLARVNTEGVRTIWVRTEPLPTNAVIPVSGQKFVILPETVAFDHMTVSLQTLPLARVRPLVPVLEACFTEEMRQMAEKRAKLLTREEETMTGEEEVEKEEKEGHKGRN